MATISFQSQEESLDNADTNGTSKPIDDETNEEKEVIKEEVKLGPVEED